VYESAGVQPVFLNQEDAISYVEGRACFRSGEIRIIDSRGATESIIPFSENQIRSILRTAEKSSRNHQILSLGTALGKILLTT
jgi:hypothetical protein